MGPCLECKRFPVFVTQGGAVISDLLCVRLVERNRKQEFPTDFAVNQIQDNHFVPLISKHVIKFNRTLGTNPPAGTAPGAEPHVVQQLPRMRRVLNINGIRRTVLQTCQAAVTFFIDLEITHVSIS